jgi:hypothetical protein
MRRSNITGFREKDLRERAERVLALRRKFERVSRQGQGRKALARAGRWALAGFWCVCVGVIGAGLYQLHPEFGHRLAYALRDPTGELTSPFPDCGAAHAAGYYDVPAGSPAYRERQDGDRDGPACEPAPGDAASTAAARAGAIRDRWTRYQGD